MIHTSKKKVIVETKGGRTATKMKTIITTNEIKKATPEVDNGGTRRSSRAKPQTIKKIETIQSPSRSLTNGTPRSAKSQAVTSTNSKFQTNLFAELSKKTSNYSPDVVSDLEEILGSPIKTTRDRSEQASRTQSKIEQLNTKGMVRVDYRSQTDDESKPATRSSKRLSNRVQPTQITIEPKTTRTSTKSKKLTVAYNASGLTSEDSQESQDEPDDNSSQISQNNLPDNIVLNIKQEKEVSYTMTDDNSSFTCEMCSAVFSDRAQLLIHVPVHI